MRGAELRRVGCNSGTVDGNWTASSQKALKLFNKHPGLKLDVKATSVDAAVEARTGRICPLICETGFRADGDKCVKITCRKRPRAERRGHLREDRGQEANRQAMNRRPSASGRSEMRPLRSRRRQDKSSAATVGEAGQTPLSYRWSKVRHRRHYSRRKNGSVRLMQAVGSGQIARHYSARVRLPGALPHVKSFISRVAFRLMNTVFNY